MSLFSALVVVLLSWPGCQWLKWKEFTSPAGRFSVLMPGTPVDQPQKVNSPVGVIELHLFVVDHNGAQYLVAYNDYPEEAVKSADPAKVLDGARNGVVANVRGRLLNETRITLQGFPGRELKVMIPEASQAMHTRLYFVKNRLYQAGVVTREANLASKDTLKFLDSFRFTSN